MIPAGFKIFGIAVDITLFAIAVCVVALVLVVIRKIRRDKKEKERTK